MEFAAGPEGSFQIYLLVSFALGLLLAAKCLVQMAFPRLRAWRLAELASGLAAFILVFLLGLDALCQRGVLASVASPLRCLIVVGTSTAVFAAQLGVSVLHSRCRQLTLQPVAWLAVVLTLAATGWSTHRYHVGNLRLEIDALYGTVLGELDPVADWVAVTDRGREVALYRWNTPANNTAGAAPSAPALENLTANCHGWVFTKGQHLLWRDGVERILEDNGYQKCEEPRSGDLIVYRNIEGDILHTGLVRVGVLGGILIESKWGVGKRFVHGPEMQPYGDRYSFYRSSRKVHALALRAARPTMSFASR